MRFMGFLVHVGVTETVGEHAGVPNYPNSWVLLSFSNTFLEDVPFKLSRQETPNSGVGAKGDENSGGDDDDDDTYEST